MCGVCGFVGDYSSARLDRMMAVIEHRGPDDHGRFWTPIRNGAQAVGLGSRRLSILDLSAAARMPITTDDGSLTIVFNGEIYNYRALRDHLEGKGHRFRTHSDTEAVLYLYQEYGPESVKRLNGMFAIAIWDSRREELFLARDHFGIKPLYYTERGRGLSFASEVKALTQLPDVPAELDIAALHQYLTFLWVPDPATAFKGVEKLPAGHWARWKHGCLHVEQFWDLTFPERGHAFPGRHEDLAREVNRRFLQAARAQLQSDVPVGAFLSAGMDSTAIVAAVADQGSAPLRTFTIAFPDRHRVGETTLDDTKVAARTAKHFGCEHTEILVEPDVVSLLPKLVWHMDEPVADPAAITAFMVCREAHRDVKVLLSGIGGDEVFAGYRRHVGHYLAERYRRLPASLRRRVIEPSILALPSLRGTPLKGWVRLAKKLARSGSLSPEDGFITHFVYLSDEQKRGLYSPDVREATRDLDAWHQHRRHFKNIAHADFLNQMLYLETKTFMVSLNLTYNDKMSMASSVEVRVPFLDWEFVDWCSWNIAPEFKLRDGTTKWILREAMANTIPTEVFAQKKAGFGAPHDVWLAHELREMVDDVLSERSVRQRGLFEPKAVRNLVNRHRKGDADLSLPIWSLLTLELWHRQFVDGKTS
ncbi:MAG: asparagine synthase (glutamine-hydrolyzing) [Acidobacteria bacterium]|nr:asparagine synthase (glutamine-hydrolyzing) [Acidobacteriota bacterium]